MSDFSCRNGSGFRCSRVGSSLDSRALQGDTMWSGESPSVALRIVFIKAEWFFVRIYYVFLFVEDASPVRRDTFGGDIDFPARGIVVEFDDGLAFLVCGHVWVPVKGSPEVLHGRDEAVVLHLKS